MLMLVTLACVFEFSYFVDIDMTDDLLMALGVGTRVVTALFLNFPFWIFLLLSLAGTLLSLFLPVVWSFSFWIHTLLSLLVWIINPLFPFYYDAGTFTELTDFSFHICLGFSVFQLVNISIFWALSFSLYSLYLSGLVHCAYKHWHHLELKYTCHFSQSDNSGKETLLLYFYTFWNGELSFEWYLKFWP